jgi:hypothetical protein
MANLNSFNSNSVDSGSTRRARIIGGAATAAVTAVVALMFLLDFNGCSKQSKTSPVTTNQSASSPAPTPAAQPAGTPEKKSEPVTKKKAVKRPSTVKYENEKYGISFRYPKAYALLSTEKQSSDSAWPDPAPMNFVGDNGETVTELMLKGSRANSYFKVSVNKSLTAEECGKFATTPEPFGASANPPADPSDDSLMPVKTNVLGVEFTKAETVTSDTETRYYHHFENGACYEFALGVEDAPDTVKPIDHLQVFDRLERIMSTVKIKSEQAPAVATSEPAPAAQPSPTPVNSPQQ